MSNDSPLDDTVPPVQVPAPDADDSTALLAELDSLLERMMALPVNNLEEDTAPAAPRSALPPPDVPLITVAETMPGSIDTASLPPAVTSTADDLYVQTLLHEHPPEPPPPQPEPPPPTMEPEPVGVWNNPPPEPVSEELATIPAPPPVLPLIESTPEPRATVLPPPGWIKPLIWCNHAFDGITTRLGAAGLWMQHPRGRMLLGWVGLLMLAAVCGLALGDCLGWTW
jgi:hypothetical protein